MSLVLIGVQRGTSVNKYKHCYRNCNRGAIIRKKRLA